MSPSFRPRILVVDDDRDVLRLAKQSLAQLSTRSTVKTEASFSKALPRIKGGDFDLLVLDIRRERTEGSPEDTTAGDRLAQKIRTRRFLPIVFHTALPGSASETETPFVEVVTKTAGSMVELRKAVQRMIDTGLPIALRAIDDHVEEVRRSFLWDVVDQESWKTLSDALEPQDIAYLLARRLASSLTVSGIKAVDKGLGPLIPEDEEGAHAQFYYVMPPLEPSLRFGDILRRGEEHLVVLTPTCDMVKSPRRRPKADIVLLGRCERIKDRIEYKRARRQNASNSTKKKLRSLVANGSDGMQQDRCFFLPAAAELPAQVLDLQQLESVPFNDAASYERLASLDSPVGEMLIAQLSRYYGRIGGPDLNVAAIYEDLLR